jgi:hypothetical protein
MSGEITYHRLKVSSLIGVALAFVIFAAIAGYSTRMTNDYEDYDHDRAQVRYETLKKTRDAEDALLTPVDDKGNPSAAWADQDKGLIKVPIEQAMAAVVTEIKAQAPAQGCVIPGTVPAPAATNAAPAAESAPASTNAAPAAGSAPASTNAAPASPAPTNKPVFKTHKIKTSVQVGNATGKLITSPTTNAPASAPNAPAAQPNP